MGEYGLFVFCGVRRFFLTLVFCFVVERKGRIIDVY